jgi:hypothetical protein
MKIIGRLVVCYELVRSATPTRMRGLANLRQLPLQGQSLDQLTRMSM